MPNKSFSDWIDHQQSIYVVILHFVTFLVVSSCTTIFYFFLFASGFYVTLFLSLVLPIVTGWVLLYIKYLKEKRND